MASQSYKNLFSCTLFQCVARHRLCTVVCSNQTLRMDWTNNEPSLRNVSHTCFRCYVYTCSSIFSCVRKHLEVKIGSYGKKKNESLSIYCGWSNLGPRVCQAFMFWDVRLNIIYKIFMLNSVDSKVYFIGKICWQKKQLGRLNF